MKDLEHSSRQRVFLRGIVPMLVFLAFLNVAGCTSATPEGKPMPGLTFAHLQGLPVNVAGIEIENRFSPGQDSRDVSSSFPTPPDVAIRRYAETRLKPAGATGALKFVIEDAHIYRSLVQPAGKFTGWLGLSRKDLYEVDLKIRLFTLIDGLEGTHSILNLQRSIAIPQDFSLAEKEEEKLKFLELLMQDVDTAVTRTLSENMQLVAATF